MTTSCQSIIQRAQIRLQDTAGVRWPATELAMYLSDAQRAIITVRPDQNAKTAVVPTVAGARQQLPSEAIALISVSGNASGKYRAIRKVDMSVLDAANRDWQSSTPSNVFVNYMYELTDPKTFFVYPPSADTTGSLELIYSVFPDDVTASGSSYTTVSGDITVSDQWSIALLNYVLSCAYSKDAEYGGNAAFAAQYLSLFKTEIGAQLQSAAVAAPKS